MTDSKALTVSNGDKGMAMLALDTLGWSIERAAELGGSPEGAIEAIRAQMVPLKEVEPQGVVYDDQAERFRFKGNRSKILADGLRPIGIKISGRMTSGEANAWLAAMILALSDLPFAYVRRAIEEVVHVPMKFLNEVEGEIRIKAARVKSRHESALRRLKRFEHDLAASKAPALPAPEPMTDEDLQGMVAPLRRIGLSAGWLTEDENGRLAWADDERKGK